MKIDALIDWKAVSQLGAPANGLDRLRRALDFFDGINFQGDRAGPQERWCGLEIQEPLASRSYAIIHRAYDPVLKREVALQLLDRDLPGTSDWLEEHRRLARVRHPNVIGVLGVGQDDGQTGIWTELSNGVPLESLMKNSASRRGGQWVDILRTLTEALQAVHDRGIVHGNIKASNVLVDPTGRVLLTGFGESLLLGEQAGRGSLRTVAPEVLLGERPDAGSDIWSLGALVYRGLTGRHAYAAQTSSQLLKAHQAPPDLKGIPKSLQGLIRSMLDSDPAERPDAIAILHQLERIRNRPARSRKSLLLGGIILALLIGIALTGLGWWQARQTDLRDAQSRATAEATLDIVRGLFQAALRGPDGAEARVIEVLERAERMSLERTDLPADVRATLDMLAGSSYLDAGRQAIGVALLDRALATLESGSIADPEAIAAILAEQAVLYCDEESEQANALIVDIRQRARGLPAEHPLQVALLAVDACAAGRRGDLDGMESRLRTALERRPPEDFPDDFPALEIQARLARLLIEEDRISEASALAEQAYEGLYGIAGPDHPSTLRLAPQLGRVHVQQYRYQDAIDLLTDALDQARASSNDDIRAWAGIAATLAEAQASNSDFEAALATTDALLGRTRDQLGNAHRLSLNALGLRARRLRDLGRLNEAAAATSEALETALRRFGPDDPLVQTLEAQAREMGR